MLFAMLSCGMRMLQAKQCMLDSFSILSVYSTGVGTGREEAFPTCICWSDEKRREDQEHGREQE